MSQNSENGFNASNGKSKTNIIFKETYDAIVAYLKILNQGTDGHDFPEKKFKKESKETSMN